MSNLKPGEFRITDQAMKIWDLPKGAAVLDIGCGRGEAVEYIENEYGYKACGIDISKVLIKEGLKRNPKLDIKCGDGEFLDGFTSFSFGGVMMECVLSLINIPEEALHEVYCVLKKGGKLFISDLYIKDPTPEFLKEVQTEAERQEHMPHTEGGCGSDHTGECTDCGEGNECNDCGEGTDCNDCADCTESTDCADCADCTDCTEGDCGSCTEGEHEAEYAPAQKPKAVNFRASGRFLKVPFIAQLEAIGYTNIVWEDCSKELDNYVAEKFMKDGTLEGCFCEEGLNPKDKHKTGYFMLTAEKPL